MEFNIIERTPKKISKYTQRYTYTYQLNGESKKYKIQMLYISSMEQKWFFDASQRYDPMFEKGDNKTKFIEEIKKWQKGGSYRKLNPTVENIVDKLKSKRKELESNIEEINKEIKQLEEAETEKAVSEYMSDYTDKDRKNLEKIKSNIEKYINGENSRYAIKVSYYNNSPRFVLYDKDKQKYRFIIWLYDNKIEFSEIDKEMMKKLYIK